MKTYYTSPTGKKIEYFPPNRLTFQDALNLVICSEARDKMQNKSGNRT